ncbi:hypothetical protein K0M31_000703 [Melipona bicolor]|uniref:Uncharacterized protein n=1 Tax=Melipona bicolor TaxID=60889 RepID=A0AA40GE25_9HYME|nr:hypothetical protein K0M31_000703 [Melipona bicolor]
MTMNQSSAVQTIEEKTRRGKKGPDGNGQRSQEASRRSIAQAGGLYVEQRDEFEGSQKAEAHDATVGRTPGKKNRLECHTSWYEHCST